MNAVMAPTIRSFLKVERSHGRLRLSFQKNYSANEFDDSKEAEATAAATEEVENSDNSEGETSANEESGAGEEVECDACLRVRDGMNEFNLEFGVEIGMEKIRRPQSCEGRRGRNENSLNWESLSVASS